MSSSNADVDVPSIVFGLGFGVLLIGMFIFGRGCERISIQDDCKETGAFRTVGAAWTCEQIGEQDDE